jgi:hypothetical protein
MGSELDLKALREYYEELRPDRSPLECEFILRQIERVERCGWCQGNGVLWRSIHGEVVHKMPCGECKALRADLLELQREVLVVSK